MNTRTSTNKTKKVAKVAEEVLVFKAGDIDRSHTSSVAGVMFYKIPSIKDPRGNLSIIEYGKQLPFAPKRAFAVYDVPSKKVRGEHAHKKQQQYLICVKGSVHVLVDDGVHREEIVLRAFDAGIYVPPLVWGTEYKYSEDGVLLVFASGLYDPNDYIRDYQEFLEIVKKRK